MTVCSFSWRFHCVVSTTGVNLYSGEVKIAFAMSLSDIFGQGFTFCSRSISDVGSIATTFKRTS
jgi:hypothetical protein